MCYIYLTRKKHALVICRLLVRRRPFVCRLSLFASFCFHVSGAWRCYLLPIYVRIISAVSLQLNARLSVIYWLRRLICFILYFFFSFFLSYFSFLCLLSSPTYARHTILRAPYKFYPLRYYISRKVVKQTFFLFCFPSCLGHAKVQAVIIHSCCVWSLCHISSKYYLKCKCICIVRAAYQVCCVSSFEIDSRCSFYVKQHVCKWTIQV